MTEYLYPNAVVYKFDILDDMYVGSTIDVSSRLRNHKADLKNGRQSKLYKRIREYGLCFNDIDFIILESYPCNTEQELRRREGVFQTELKPTLNDNIAGRTKQEYRNDNKDIIAKKKKEYNDKNKEHISKREKEYRDRNKTQINQKNKEKAVCEYCEKERCKRFMVLHHTTCKMKPRV